MKPIVGSALSEAGGLSGPMLVPPDLIAVDARTVAQTLGVSVRTVRGLLAANEIRSFTVGRSRRVLVRDLRAYLDGRRGLS